jgi:hypothetical protein
LSAGALRSRTTQLVAEYIHTVTEELIERTGDTEAQMHVNQGIIQGARNALLFMEDAYKEIGN